MFHTFKKLYIYVDISLILYIHHIEINNINTILVQNRLDTIIIFYVQIKNPSNYKLYKKKNSL